MIYHLCTDVDGVVSTVTCVDISLISPEFSTVPTLVRDVFGTTNTSGASVDS